MNKRDRENRAEIIRLIREVVKRVNVDMPFAGDGHWVLPFSAVVDPVKYPEFPYYKVGSIKPDFTKEFQRTHPDGWTITGMVRDWEDYFQGVLNFKATHPKLGSVSGNFNDEIIADSDAAYSDFYSKHPPKVFDPGDI